MVPQNANWNFQKLGLKKNLLGIPKVLTYYVPSSAEEGTTSKHSRLGLIPGGFRRRMPQRASSAEVAR